MIQLISGETGPHRGNTPVLKEYLPLFQVNNAQAVHPHIPKINTQDITAAFHKNIIRHF